MQVLVFDTCTAIANCPAPPVQLLIGKMINLLEPVPLNTFQITNGFIAPSFALEIHGFFFSYQNHTGKCDNPTEIETRPFTIYEKGNPNKFLSLGIVYSPSNINIFLQGSDGSPSVFTCCQLSPVFIAPKFHFVIVMDHTNKITNIRLKGTDDGLLSIDTTADFTVKVMNLMGSFTDPMLTAGGNVTKGCFTGKLFNWMKKISPITDLDITLSSSANKRLASILEYWVIKPRFAVGPAERYVYDLSKPLIQLAKTSGGPEQNDFGYTNYQHHIHTDDQFSFVSPDQSMRFIRSFPIYDMVRGDSNSLLVSGKLAINLARPVINTGELWCTQSFIDAKQGAFLIYSVVFDGGANRIGIYAQFGGCIGGSDTKLKITLIAERFSTVLLFNQLTYPFTGTTKKTFEFVIDIFKNPMNNKVDASISFSHFSTPTTKVPVDHLVNFDVMDLNQQFVHGIGNIERRPSQMNSHYHVFKYEYRYLTVSLGGYQNDIRQICYDRRVVAQDNTLKAVGAFFSTSIVYPISLPVVCLNEDDMLHSEGCISTLTTVSISNCFAEMTVNSMLLCVQCNPGYFRVNYINCVLCQQDCHRCEDATNCLVCKLGFIRKYLNDFYLCQQISDPTPTVYMPEYQTVVPAVANLVKSRLPELNIASTNHTYTVTGSDVAYTLYYELDIDASTSLASVSSTQQIIVSKDSNVLQLRQLWDTATGMMRLYGIKHQTSSLSQDIVMTFTSSMNFKITSFKVNVLPIPFDSDPCLISTSSGDCIFCNPELGYYLPMYKKNCELLPLGRYVDFNNKFIGLPDTIQYTCPPQTGMARCKGSDPSKAADCLPGYYLSSGTCQLCPGSPCNTCASATNCTSCAPNHYLLNTSLSGIPMDGSCVTICSIDMSPDNTGVCIPCPADFQSDGMTCTPKLLPIVLSPASEYLQGSASWDMEKFEYTLSFEKEFDMSILSDFSLVYNKNPMIVDFRCFATAGVRKTCTSKVEIKDKVELNDEDIVLELFHTTERVQSRSSPSKNFLLELLQQVRQRLL